MTPFKIFAMVCLSMLAFAANSALTRAAMLDGGIEPMGFAMVRVFAGAITLGALVALRSMPLRPLSKDDAYSATYLTLYLVGFSIAYRALDTGAGALILFGAVQISMFFWAFVLREQLSITRIVGAIIAFAGLLILVAPSTSSPDLIGILWMILGAIGWTGYSLMGRKATVPIYNSAVNFVLASPVLLITYLLITDTHMFSGYGLTLAIISGVVTSGLGYIIWYSVLPYITASFAAVAQLSVPIIAFAIGVIWLGDPASWRFFVASCVVIGGIAVSLIPVTKRK